MAKSLSRRVDRDVRHRLMRACFRPTGIAHLEDPVTLDKIRFATSSTTGGSIGTSVTYLVMLAEYKLEVLIAAALVANYFSPVLAIALLIARSIIIPYQQRAYRAVVDAQIGQVGELRRYEYLRRLGMDPPAAKELRLFSIGAWLIERYDRIWFETMRKIWKSRTGLNRQVILVSIPATAVVVVVPFILLGISLERNEISLTAFAIVAQSLVTLGTFFSDALATEPVIAYGSAALSSVQAAENACNDTPAQAQGKADPISLPRNEIVFEGVHFRYPGSDREVLSGLDLTIQAGRSMALVGSNGVGKTTVLKLLCRFYEPTAGRILVDGVDLRDLNPQAWQRRFAAIFQDFVRFQLPAADNIRLGAPRYNASKAILERAASRAGATSVIDGLPHGWETILAAEYRGGSEISEGQWQKVALARALYAAEAGAGILILDEPTASLDARSEVDLFNRFFEIASGVTTIVVSHRFSTVRQAEHICVLGQNGVIVEQGNHDSLIRANGAYARMFNVQAERFITGDKP
ncbi:MAG: ABC transporter ATP-binding protein [Gammaproteobacteria bacterium]